MYRIFITAIIFLISCSAYAQTASRAESVEYDPIGNRFLCGNDAVSIVEIDTSGSLSYFGTGLSASLGMEIIDNYLFCIVATSQNGPINLVVAYDLTTEMEVASITVPEASFLNGMTSDGMSTIWVADFQGRAIYELDFSDISQPSFEEIVSSSSIPNTLNGLTYDQANNRLVFVSWTDDRIRQVNLQDLSVSVVVENIGIQNMDGIDMDSDQNFYVSSWTPTSRITKFSNDFMTSEIINIPGMSNPADICIAKEINMIAIPSGQHNVILWPLETTTTTSVLDTWTKSEMSIKPTLTSGFSNLEILQEDWNNMECKIIDINGKVLQTLSFQNIGQSNFPIDLSPYANGYYIVHVVVDNKYRLNEKLILSK